jgi:cytochrome c-type biogenesis protein CcmH
MPKTSKAFLSILGLTLLMVSFLGPAFAQGSEPTDDEVNAIARQLYCPVCENIPLDACGTVACEQWRGIIRDKLAEGETEDQIKAYFVAQYGDRVLAEPPTRGFNWLAYLIPVLVLGGGAVLLSLGFRRWKQEQPVRATSRQSKKDSSLPKPEQEYLQRIEEELKERSRSQE